LGVAIVCNRLHLTFNSAKSRFIVVVTGAFSGQGFLSAALDVNDSEYFEPGTDVLIDASKSTASIPPLEMGQLVNALKTRKQKIRSCRYAVIVARSSGLIMTNILAAFAVLVSSKVRGFVSLKSPEAWLETETKK
jgi:hypothetical protein